MTYTLERRPLDIDYLEFVCNQEIDFISALPAEASVSQDVTSSLTELLSLIQQHKETQQATAVFELERQHGRGRPRMHVPEETLEHFLDLGLPLGCISTIMGFSRTTLWRRMREHNLSVTALYSKCTDDELDAFVSEIKSTMPHAGYRVVRGALLGRGHRVQWDRIHASMHRVDGLGILSRMSQLGCIARRTYSVPYPKYMMHIDTNHKLIR